MRGHVERTGEMRNACIFWSESLKSRHRHRWEDNNILDLK